MYKNFIIILLMSLLVSLTAGAQSKGKEAQGKESKGKEAQGKVTIVGKVYDSEERESMPGCTVLLMKSDSVTMENGTVTASNGSFTMKNVPDGQHVVKISFVGYHPFYRTISVKHLNSASQNLGTIFLTPNTIQLQQAVVTAQMQQVEVKDDTIMFNAAAFKVPEGSVLEELIRKLPGAEVGDDGSITINGKKVSKILVEGKEFFSNDKSMAMKNLPSNIVEKVKTYDKQSDLSRITGIDDGEEETVIDLSIKKGMKQGWFGNVDGAYGTRNRYSAKLNVNRFTDKKQYSLIGSVNNTNDRTGGGGGRGGNNGITTSAMAGGNIALDLDPVEIGGNVRYSYNKNTSETKNSSQNFVSTQASYSNSIAENLSSNNRVNGDFKIEWKIDTLTTLLFRPSFSWGNGRSQSGSTNATFKDNPYVEGVKDPLNDYDLIADSLKINHSGNNSTGRTTNYSAGGNLVLNRKLKGKPWFGEANETGLNGRNVSLRLSGNFSGNTSKNFSYNDIRFVSRDSTSRIFRHRDNPSSNTNVSAGVTYSEPIMRNLYAQLNYSFQYQNRHADGNTYDFGHYRDADGHYVYIPDDVLKDWWVQYGQFGLTPPDYNIFRNDSLSRYSDNKNYIHNIELSFRWITSHVNLNVGVQVQQQRQVMEYNYQGFDTIASRNYARVSPTLNFRYRFTRQHSIRITYRGNMQQPDMTDLFELTDNSNPLNISMGNSKLKPSFTNRIGLDYNNYIASSMRTFFVRGEFSNTLNSITRRTEYNTETGVQTTQPVNINGNWNVSGTFGFNTPLFIEKLMLNTSTSASWRNNVGYIFQNRETLRNTVHQLGLGERISLTLRQDLFDIRLNGSINYSRSRSELVATSNQNTFNFHYGVSTTWRFEWGLGFSTDIGMNSRRGYASAEMNTNELIWNAQVSYRFLKNRAATVSIQAFDILNQRSNISRNISAYSRRDSETNAINSYVMAHFIYRLNLFGNSESRRQMREARRDFDQMDFNRGEGGRGGGDFGGGRGGFGGGGGRGDF